MFSLKNLGKSVFAAAWISILTFPLMVIRVNTVTDTVEWRWGNLALVFFSTVAVAILWIALLERKNQNKGKKAGQTNGRQYSPPPPADIASEATTDSGNADRAKSDDAAPGFFGQMWATLQDRIGRVQARVKDVTGGSLRSAMQQKRIAVPVISIVAVVLAIYPFVGSLYETNIMVRALTYVMLGLGLNIVVGLGGMLNLGYVAFYAVGAYAYALLNLHFGLGFWIVLPIGGALAAVAGLVVAFPVLRLRGDYLAIVTLGFAEIVRLVLVNWTDLSRGPAGIANIPRPPLFGIDLTLGQSMIYMYFIMIGLTALTIFTIVRLENSRIGRALVAMREDEIASEAMGIDIAKTKLMAFGLGAFWAGLAGVAFASYTTFINPRSFSIWESVIVLCVVVLGGMGSILGVIVAGLAMILVPEYLRAFSEYRMLIFGAVLVIMMVFRPQGLIPAKRRAYTIKPETLKSGTLGEATQTAKTKEAEHGSGA